MYKSEEGDSVYVGLELDQPNVHYIYWSYFNAINVHKKLAVRPRVGTNSLLLVIWLGLLAIAETNAYVTDADTKS
jgi:hypothetical protein